MSRTWNAFDVLEGVLALMGEPAIPASVPVVHNAFYSLAQKKKYKPFFEGYLFQRRTGFFFSEKLQVYLENMELAGLLSCVNPDFDFYEVRPKLKDAFDEHVKESFSAPELKTLTEMAHELRQQLPRGIPAASAV